jgi:4-amino-4-deoxy-L-arabinose transferase-like glycosyltransferase
VTDEPPVDPPIDPVLARRQLIGRWVSIAQRIGYALFAVAIVVFFVGLARRDFSGATALVLELSLLFGSLLLAPAIVIGYAVRAADRADREGDWR